MYEAPVAPFLVSTPDGENPVAYVMERDSSEIKAVLSHHCARRVTHKV